jgi:hypothetical protein
MAANLLVLAVHTEQVGYSANDFVKIRHWTCSIILAISQKIAKLSKNKRKFRYIYFSCPPRFV